MNIRVRCPAKINPFLSVGPPGPGGYHPIRTIFQAVSLYDNLSVEVAKTEEISCDWPGMPAENTLTRTLKLLRELYPIPPLRISLAKRIPAESGLGGGSSDAAGLIRAVAKIRGVPIDQHDVDIASAVGKDVPFFLIGGLARGEGFGDKVTPMEGALPGVVLLAKPNAGVSTAAAYAQLDAAPRPWRDFPGELETVYNDFERVAPCVCSDLIERLRVFGALSAGLSGSGSACFGLFESADTAEEATIRFQTEFPGAWHCVARPLSRAESLNMEVAP